MMERGSAEIVLSNTEPEAVIITRHFDKLLFPDRRIVVASFPDDDLMPIVDNLTKYYPVYYFHFRLSEKDINYLNERRLSPYNLKIIPKTMTGLETYLYSLEKTEVLSEPLVENDL